MSLLAAAATPLDSAAVPRLGATLHAEGTDFAIRAPGASGVRLCLFDDTGERQLDLSEHGSGLWAGRVEGVGVGQRYGYRVDGPWDPHRGLRFNSDKLLVDPYARALDGRVQWRPEIFGHRVDALFHGDPDVRDDRDSAPYVSRSVVVDDTFDWDGDPRPATRWDRTVLYEGHVRGLTMRHPDVPARLRGTYAGIANEAFIAHLQALGVTALELLPVHAFTSEPHLVNLGLSNYWGYNTLCFFAPHLPYASTNDPLEAVAEFKGMVKALHRAGIEVILDVVYNHTCEQDANKGATLSWRGLGAPTYYRLDDSGRDIDTTGCGNSLNFGEPDVVTMTLDSLRYWVTEMHVDGFRFDLAPTLGRDERNEFTRAHPFFAGIQAEDAFRDIKFIAEPWDLGPHGWRTGAFPPPFSDWNDHFRDTVRSFWLGDLAADAAGRSGHGVADLATRIAASPDLFYLRSPMASINYVACHDGFPMADLTAYDTKHNLANGEHGRDGSDNNRSWNFGIEGHAGAGDERESMRRRAIRGMLGTLLLSTGVPMLLGGDEMGRTQGGNNNAYCQDNETSWVDWDLADWQRDLQETTAFLIGLRNAHPVLRQRAFFPGDPKEGDELAALHWHAIDGQLLTVDQWQDGRTRTVQAVFDGTDVGDTQLLLVLHGSAGVGQLVLPHQAGVSAWKLLWDSSHDRPDQVEHVVVRCCSQTYEVPAASISVFIAAPAEPR